MARYEKEIEAKQRVIAQLTQANREFETLCLNGVVGDQEGELVKLRMRMWSCEQEWRNWRRRTRSCRRRRTIFEK